MWYNHIMIFLYTGPAKNEKGVYFVCYYSFLFVYTCDTDSCSSQTSSSQNLNIVGAPQTGIEQQQGTSENRVSKSTRDSF